MPRKYLIVLIVIFLVIGTIGIAALLPGPMIEITPGEEIAELAGSALRGSRDADLITGAVTGVPSVPRSAYLNFTEEVGVEDGKLEPFHIIAKNTGQTDIHTRIDVSVIKVPKFKTMLCRDSFSETSISPGDELTTELDLDCEFEGPGKYELYVHLIDQSVDNQNIDILETVRAEFTIQEICKLTSD